MLFEEIIPHLNKIATLYLVDNRRRVGWLYIPSLEKCDKETVEEVYFITVLKGRRMVEAPRAQDVEKLDEVKETIPLRDIIRIRSAGGL